MGALFEPFILYIILFLSGSSGQSADIALSVTLAQELYRILLYTIPSLALIWYLLLRKPLFNLNRIKPGIADLISAGIAFPGLLLIGFSIALSSPYFTGIQQGPLIIPPSGKLTWTVLIFSCLLTGYLEESFFRFYLLSKFKMIGLDPVKAALVSTAMFAICHIYEGPWGFLNAALCGILLAFIFLRYRSLHGIAISHGLYNICSYIMLTLQNNQNVL